MLVRDHPIYHENTHLTFQHVIRRKDVELERLERPPASLEFPLIEDLDKYEERVIYYNNQRISILRQKTSEGEEEANPDY